MYVLTHLNLNLRMPTTTASWALGSFASVAELQAEIRNVSVVDALVPLPPGDRLHWAVDDAHGGTCCNSNLGTSRLMPARILAALPTRACTPQVTWWWRASAARCACT